MTRLLHAILASLLITTLLPDVASAQTNFEWDGSQNDNWDDGSNWEGNIGWPNGSTHNAVFDGINYGPNDVEIDLRGQTIDIDSIRMFHADERLRFYSSSGTGTLRVYGNIMYDNNGVGGETGPHDFEIDLEIMDTSLWQAGANHLLKHTGDLSGSGTVRLGANTQAIGTVLARLFGANSFTGRFRIEEGILDARDLDVLQFANVEILWDDGLQYDNIETPGIITIGSLANDGDFDSAGHGLTIQGTDDVSYSGTLVGSVDHALTKTGPGNQTLAGEVLDWDQVRNEGEGELNLTGSGAFERAYATAGDLNFQDGTFVLDSEETNVLHVRQDATIRVQSGADVELTGVAGDNRVVLTHDARLHVEDAGSTLITPRLNIGPSGAGLSRVNVQLGGLLTIGDAHIGDWNADDGASGEMFVLSGGHVDIQNLNLWRRGSVSIFGDGSLETNRIIEADAEPNTILIADPDSGHALTIGTDGGSSTTDSRFEEIGGPGSASILKVGAGTLELTGDSTYSGGTFIDGGTVLANAQPGDAALGLGPVIVGSGATLGGVGDIIGDTTVESGGTLAPGNSIDAMSTGAVDFLTGSTLAIEVGAPDTSPIADQLAAAGAVALAGTLDVTYLGGFAASPGDTFVILTGTTISGTFDVVNYPDAQDWVISYAPDAVSIGICGAACDCPSDLDGNGVVDVTDMLTLVGAWGANPGHVADLNGDDVVDVTDLLALLGAWGQC